MTSKGTIRVESIVETEYGEKAVLDSPFDAKNWIKVLPWEDGQPSTERIDPDDPAVEAAQDYGFGGDFEPHPSWDAVSSTWRIDADDLDGAIEFWSEYGWDVDDESR